MHRLSLLSSALLALVAAVLLTSCGGDATDSSASDEAPPFEFVVEPYDTLAVGFHSFAFGETADGRWIAIGGRVAGFHGFGPGTNFPNTQANEHLYVYDRASGSLDSLADSTLGRDLDIVLSSTNFQHRQVGDTLYVTGGYGIYTNPDSQAVDAAATHPFLAVIDVNALADAISRGDAASARAAIAYRLGDTRAAMTGGELMHLADGYFYQVFGHHFTGRYQALGASCGGLVDGNATQIQYYNEMKYYRNYAQCKTLQRYANEIRRFRIADSSGVPVIRDYTAYTDGTRHDSTTRYRRRDLPVTPNLTDDGTQQGFTAWAGVFKPNLEVDNLWTWWENPVRYTPALAGADASAPGTAQIDTAFHQTRSVYATAYALIADEERTYTTFFGGIDGPPVPGTTEGLPFVNTITTVTRDRTTGRTWETVYPNTVLPDTLGSEGEFVSVLDGGAAYHRGGKPFVDLASLPADGAVQIGFIFGGILADVHQVKRNAMKTTSNNVVYRVLARRR